MALTCRFYEQKYPEMEDVVMVNVRSIEDMGAYVHLLEYNNTEGMILIDMLHRIDASKDAGARWTIRTLASSSSQSFPNTSRRTPRWGTATPLGVPVEPEV